MRRLPKKLASILSNYEKSLQGDLRLNKILVDGLKRWYELGWINLFLIDREARKRQ